MLEDILRETIEILENKFYKEKFYFSYSSISKLLYSPAVFYQLYILKQRIEAKEKYLINGSVIHCLLLEPEEFENRYLVSPLSLPSASVKPIIDYVYKKHKNDIQFNNLLTLNDFEHTILEAMKLNNYYQKLNEDTDRLKKILIAESYSYWTYLIKDTGGKELIDRENYEYCLNSVNIIKQTPGVIETLGIESDKEVYNELYLECFMDTKGYGLKGYLDNLVIDHKNKSITVNDFKTSGKSLSDFPDSVEFYNYWLQATIYMILVTANYKELIDLGYQINFNFIVIDKYTQVYTFPVSDSTIIKWLDRYNNTLEAIDHHYNNRRYELPYIFDTGNMIL